MDNLYTTAVCWMLLMCATSQVRGAQHSRAVSTDVRKVAQRPTADLPDILLKGMIVIKIKTLSYIRELSYPNNNLTRRLTALCEIEAAKLFRSVKGKQTVKVESFRRGRWSAVIVVMLFDSAGNGNMSEISEIVRKNVKDPGKFIDYQVDRRMASFRPQGVFCQPRVHYAFESSSDKEVYDDSGFDNNGVIYGNMEITRHGKCGKAGKFKNGYIYLRRFRKTKLSGTDAIVVAFWMKINNPRSTTSLFRGYYKGAVIELFMERGILKWKFITVQEATAFLVKHTKLLRSRQWTHIVGIYDPYTRKAKLYINSELTQEVDVRKGMIRWGFTSSLRFGMTSAEGYLDDLYVYDCVLSEKVLDGIRKECWCQELCAPRGKNEFLIRMILASTNTSSTAIEELASRVKNGIMGMFEEISGEQRVQTIGYRPQDVDSVMVDYSLQSIGNSDTRYLAGVMQPAITSKNIAGVELASNDVSFIPISGKGVCLSSEMKCDNGECINRLWKCDGEINCADGSDEVDCGEIIEFNCQSDEFTCNQSRVLGVSDCIKARYRCDGQLDCDDDSDEEGCAPLKLITAPRSLIILAEGETAVCTCVASGVPHPKVSWYHKGREVLSLRGKMSVTSVAGRGKLAILNAGQEDSGDYICKISDNLVLKKTIAPSCTIKVRAFGSVCRPPFFNSVAQHSDECLRCFCSGRSTNCRSAQLFWSKITSQWDCYTCTKKDEPTLVDINGKSVDAYQTLTSTPLYWKLPVKYSGNMLTSYGGNLVFTFETNHIQNGLRLAKRNVDKVTNYRSTVSNYVNEVPNNRSWSGRSHTSRTLNDVPSRRGNSPRRSGGTVSGPRVLNLTEGRGVFIVGSNGIQLGSTSLDQLDDGVFSIRITEENLKETQKRQTTSRPTLLRVLAEMEYIFIKATSFEEIVLRLLSVSLDTAVDQQTSGDKVHLVEQCACPLGYRGFSCEKCAPGYFRENRTLTCMKCLCNNHSSTCHPETGKCLDCAHNTQGFNCQVCKPGYYGNPTHGTSRDCKKCNCPLTVETNSFSSLCYLDTDNKSTCSHCQPGYTGRNCEICAQGYEGNATILGSTCYKVGNFSRCDLAGSTSQRIGAVGEVQCTCKSNVLGSICDKCREGTFNLQVFNPSGCERCFCSGKSKICTNLVGFRFMVTMQLANLGQTYPTQTINSRLLHVNASMLEDVFKLATLHSRRVEPHLLHEANNDVYLWRIFSGTPNKRPLFWHLPMKFSGSKVASYGGYLEYTVTYSWNATKKPSNAYDTILMGKRFGIIYVGRKLKRREYENGRKVTYKVPLTEKFWRFSNNQRVSKILFVVFLGRIEKLLILATPHINMIETRLHEVKMDVGVENITGVQLPGIERCSCPPAYGGYSCESCAVGYKLSYRVSRILGRCVKCNCHGHASNCHQRTGVCLDCQNNTNGKYCETCKPGFYGKPKTRSPCRPCPCPRVESSNSDEPQPTCSLDEEGEPVCDRCPEGHVGKLCDRCEEGFTGNPKVYGEVCKPVLSCGCNYAGTQICDESTKTCICKKNVEGEKCDQCKRGFYNLREKNDDGCTPCFCMGYDTTCRVSDNIPESLKFSPHSRLPSSLVITTEDMSRNTSELKVDLRSKRVRFLEKCWLQQPDVYWMLPEKFLGNKVLYYGGKLSILYSSHGSAAGERKNETNFLKIKGNGLTLDYVEHTRISPNKDKTIEILLVESHWHKTDRSFVSRDEFMQVLVHVNSILIPVSYTREPTESRLGDIVLVAASEKNVIAKPENCDCPYNTAGQSCESCDEGYTRNGRRTARCVRCQCHGHSKQCGPTTGVCQDCKDNTAGKHCELCARGFYGDAKKGERNDCKECPCPLPGSSNRFSETCFLDKDGLPTCDACLEGYTGRRCEKCSLNYTGNPSTPGGKCFKAPVSLIPKLKIVPDGLTVQEGDSAQFVCNVKSPRPTQITWSRRQGKTLSERAIVQGNVLRFNSLKISDRGSYVCTASNDFAVRTATTLLEVKRQQLSAVIVDVSPKSRYIPVGGTARFSCTSKTSSRYSITWSRENNNPLPSSSHVKDGTLIISNARLGDGGTYICTGKNLLNIDRAIISLHVGVVVKPQVSVTPRRQIVDVANTVKFRCSASAGFPAATLHWERGDGRQLPQFSKFLSRTGVFKILAASRRDEGEYMCIARNTGGESVMRVQLLVRGPNSAPKVYIRPNRVTVDEGETAVLRCDISGEEPMQVEWIKTGGILPRTAVVRRNILEIKKTTIRERGRYVCTATNKYGQASAIGRLFVNKDESKLPEVTIKPSGKVISVMQGKTLTLLCEVAGKDIVKNVQWTRQSPPGVLSENFELNLAKIKIEDTGVYECSVKTDRGQGKATVSVIVQRNDILPRVHVQPSHVTLIPGKSVTIECKVSSTLPVTVTWIRADGSPIDEGYLIKDTVLLIRNVKTDDEGTYICVGKNKFGASKATVELSVLKR